MLDLYVNTALSHPLVRWVVALLVVNVIVGIAASLYTKTFRLAAVADWLLSRALPYLLVAVGLQVLVFAALGESRELVQAAATAVWAFVLAALLGKIFNTVKELGVPIPSVLTDKSKAETTSTP